MELLLEHLEVESRNSARLDDRIEGKLDAIIHQLRSGKLEREGAASCDNMWQLVSRPVISLHGS